MTEVCSRPVSSATVRRRLLRLVSPLVIARMITPTTTRIEIGAQGITVETRTLKTFTPEAPVKSSGIWW